MPKDVAVESCGIVMVAVKVWTVLNCPEMEFH
jgi:hypothetical protein